MRTPKETYEKYTAIGMAKTQTKPIKVFVLAVLAGAYIAFAGIGSTFAGSLVNKLCAALIFCGGLSMVLVAGSELFTGNCLLIMPLCDGKVKLSAVIKNLCIVYIGNLIGSLLVALLAVYSGALDSVSEAAINTALSKTSLTFLQAVFKGVLCNILVCVAVWMSFTSDKTGDKITAVIFPVTLFVLCGFEHSVANMYFIPAGILLQGNVSGGVTVGDFLLKNLLPVTLGNIIGGMFVGLIYSFVYGKRTKK